MNEQRNALIFTEQGNLFIRKPNGLEYEFQNVDRPELGFEYDVVVYDDIEIKIMKWNSEVGFDMQEKTDLTDAEKQMIEQYIDNSEPPMGISLNGQVIQNDPNGEADLIHGGYTDNMNGEHVEYSYKNWLPRWTVSNPNDGWAMQIKP